MSDPTETPDHFDKLLDCYDAGMSAYYNGKARDDNPEESEPYRETWFAGFDRALSLDD